MNSTAAKSNSKAIISKRRVNLKVPHKSPEEQNLITNKKFKRKDTNFFDSVKEAI